MTMSHAFEKGGCVMQKLTSVAEHDLDRCLRRAAEVSINKIRNTRLDQRLVRKTTRNIRRIGEEKREQVELKAK